MFATFLRRLAGRSGPGKAGRRPAPQAFVARVELLEDRNLMDTGLSAVLRANLTRFSDSASDGPAILFRGIPALNSNPGASHSLYLDFNGHFEPTWSSDGMSFTNVTTQPFDTDGNTASFSSGERALIRDIWARVAEDYAPFDINVTTVEPPSFANGVAMRVAIGATNMGFTNSGYSSIGSFSDDQPNVVYVFSDNILNWVNAGDLDGDGRAVQAAAAIATTASHEAGHSFGLVHQRVFDSAGNPVNNYNPGTNDWTPIMGDNIASDRTTWSNGLTDVLKVWRYRIPVHADEMKTLSDVLGYRADDHSDNPALATPLTVSGSFVAPRRTFGASGIIGQMSDVDYFSLHVSRSGLVNVKVDVAASGPNLDSVLEVYRWRTFYVGSFPFRRLELVVRDNPANTGTGNNVTFNLGAQLSLNLAADDYVIAVRSTGEYGSVGQYTLSGSVPGLHLIQPIPLPTIPPLPTPGPLVTLPVEAVSVKNVLSVNAGGAAAVMGGASPVKAVVKMQEVSFDPRGLDAVFSADSVQDLAGVLGSARVGLKLGL